MDKELNDVMIAVLKNARALVLTGEEPFICLALLEDYNKEGATGIECEAIDGLVYYIEETLKEDCYSTWLFLQTRADVHLLPQAEKRRLGRNGRLAWIDAMIAALEKGERLPEKPSLPYDYKGEV